MTTILGFVGTILAGYAGYNELHWCFILISALPSTFGYCRTQLPRMISGFTASEHSCSKKVIAIILWILGTWVIGLVFPAIVYFIASLFN